ncbi:MAG: hypothetical protein ABIO44_13320 [Saprospiraceae bacterium]
MELLKMVLEDLRNEFPSFSRILFGVIIFGLAFLAISISFFSYELTDADIPCGLIASFIIAVTIHQYEISNKD